MSEIVVIGADVSGLVAAAYLKRAGHKTTVVGKRGLSVAAADSGWVPEAVIRDLGLEGLQIELPEVPADAWTQHEKRWPAFCDRMASLARFLESLYLTPAPDPLTETLGGYRDLAAIALRMRSLGREGMEDLLRFLPMPAADFLDEWFETDGLKGVLGAVSVLNLAQGPRSGGTAFNLLHHHVGAPRGAFGVARSNVHEVLRRALAPDIREAGIREIRASAGAVAGVVLETGEEIGASAVVSALDPCRTLVGLADAGWLDPELVRALTNVRARGVAARVILTLDRPAPFRTLTLAPSLDAIERAYDDWKYGRISAAPLLSARARAGEGAPVVDVIVQYVPHDLPPDAHAAARASIVECVKQALGERLVAHIESAVAYLPQDLETGAALPQGQPNHAEIALDQVLWMRPAPELAGYATPIRGLYLCGPAMHPGIPVLTGMSAAKAVTRHLKRNA